MKSAVKIKKRKKWSREDYVINILVFAILATVTIVTLYPFINVLAISLNDATDALRGGIYFWPRKFSLESYRNILHRETFMHGALVSVARTVIGTPLAVLATTALAFVLSRKDLVGKKPLTLLFIFTMYFGGGLVPYYMVLKNIHMLDSFWVYIFPNLVSVYNMILVKSYIEGMPEEIFESAKIDGANDLCIFFKMVMPLSKPIIMTIALFVAINHWNSWFDSYLYTSSTNLKTMQAVLVEILNQYQTGATSSARMSNAASGVTVTPDSIRMAATMVATLPIIMIYPFVQKYFVKGIMLGAVKS